MKYDEIMGLLPEDLRKYCGGDRELTEKLYNEGKLTFKLITLNVGDKVKRKGSDMEYTVVGLAQNKRGFFIDETCWCYIPWADDWEKIE